MKKDTFGVKKDDQTGCKYVYKRMYEMNKNKRVTKTFLQAFY